LDLSPKARPTSPDFADIRSLDLKADAWGPRERARSICSDLLHRKSGYRARWRALPPGRIAAASDLALRLDLNGHRLADQCVM
jgi:hypothetical protein